jgi:hypothetical protein
MTSINQSLSNLGNCVRGLLRPGRQHIPFRNSKLTRLLQDSLGGTSQCGFVVTVSPSELAHEETISTLQFADRVKRVQVKSEMNTIETSETLLRKLEQELIKAREENKELKSMLDEQKTKGTKKRNVDDDDFEYDEQNADASNIGHIMQKCLATTSIPSATIASKPESFIGNYFELLRKRKCDGLTSRERLVLLEWALSNQQTALIDAKSKAQDELLAVENRTKQIEAQLKDCKASLDESEDLCAALKAQLEEKEHEFTKKLQELMGEKLSLQQDLVEAKNKLLQQETQVWSSKRRTSEPQANVRKNSVVSTTSASSTTLKNGRTVETPSSSNIIKRSNEPSPVIQPKVQFNERPSSRRSSISDDVLRLDSMTIRRQSPMTSRSNEVVIVSSKSSTPLTRTFNSSRATPVVSKSKVQVWDRFLDDSTGRPYYHCKETGETTWRRPSTQHEATIIVRGE